MKLSGIALMTMVVMSCAAMQSKTIEPWKIEVTSSGGLAGRGAGRFVVDSDGRLSLTTMTGQNCNFTLTDAERALFTELLTNAKPDEWSSTYKPKNEGADRISYMLSLEMPSARKQVSWIDDPLPMPPDLGALVDAIILRPDSLRVKYAPQCR